MTGKIPSLLFIILLAVCAPPVQAADDEVRIQPDVVYGHKDGMALTMDVLAPAKANGAGLLYIQSSGWYSKWLPPQSVLPACKELLDNGYTIFVVRHGSAPKYRIPEIVEDIRRAARFVRLNARTWGVDTERVGAIGASAGGHLALMLATTADDGLDKSDDPVLRQGDQLAAVVAFFAPSDLRQWVRNPPRVIRETPELRPPLSFAPSLAEKYSPLLHASRDDPPVLLIHGDKDPIVPIRHSQRMLKALRKAHVESELVVVKGAGHGFSAENYDFVAPQIVEWLAKHLLTGPGR